MKRLLALFLSRALPAFASEQSPHFQVHGNHQVDFFPLKSSHSEISITGPIAQGELTQTYTNDGDQPIGATYIFPASTKAAVHGMTMKIGDRTIVAEIQEKQKAREIFEEAKKVTNLGLKYQLLTPFTSFVTGTPETRESQDDSIAVKQAQPLPHSVSQSAKSDGSSASVPEPSSGLLVIWAGLFTVTLRVRSN